MEKSGSVGSELEYSARHFGAEYYSSDPNYTAQRAVCGAEYYSSDPNYTAARVRNVTE